MPIEYAGRGDPVRTLSLLWRATEPPGRGPKPGLTLERIVATAIAIADAEGLDALSMRRLAGELGVGTMTLYRYVPSKGELLDVMLDTVEGEEPLLEPVAGDLRATLERIARSAWNHFHCHPWVLQVAVARPVMGPKTLRAYDRALAVLKGFGLSYAETVGTLMAIDGFVRGLARGSVEAALAERVTGISDNDWWRERNWFWERFFDPEQFPTISAMWESGEMADEAVVAPESAFEFGLPRLLDGLSRPYAERQAHPGAGDQPAPATTDARAGAAASRSDRAATDG